MSQSFVQKEQQELLRHRARTALSVYLQRGQEALKTLEGHAAAGMNGSEEFLELLKRRDAAFHNFRALDALLIEAGGDLATDGETQRLWREIQSVNATLGELMQGALGRLQARVGQSRRARATADAYRSGLTTGPRLVKKG